MNWQKTYSRWAHYREAIGFGFYDDWTVEDDAQIVGALQVPYKAEHAVDDLEFAAEAVLS